MRKYHQIDIYIYQCGIYVVVVFVCVFILYYDRKKNSPEGWVKLKIIFNLVVYSIWLSIISMW